MKVLFDIGHPAHVHLFKNFIFYLRKKGHKVFVLTRDKEITNELLDHYQIDFTCISSSKGNGFFAMLWELFSRNLKMLKHHFLHKFNISFGTSTSIAHLTFLTFGKVKSYNFSEDDDAIVPLHTYATYPFTSKIVVPETLEYTKWQNKRIVLPTYHELAYLHPQNFKPDESVLKKYNLSKGKYVIFRLSALNAHHDKDAKGISLKLREELISKLNGYEIIESFEEDKSRSRINSWDMHHLLAFSKLIISDSQTMTIEAAMLGVPSIRINTFIGKSTVISELENKYKLTYGFFPNNEVEIIKTLNYLLEMENVSQFWQEKKQVMLDQKIDFNEWMIDYFEKIETGF